VTPTVDVDELDVRSPVAPTQIATARLEAITPTTKPSSASPSPHRPWTGGAGRPVASGDGCGDCDSSGGGGGGVGGADRPTHPTGGGGRPSTSMSHDVTAGTGRLCFLGFGIPSGPLAWGA
jgi:hypothetical protein